MNKLNFDKKLEKQMSYHNKIELEIEPISSPDIIRNCSKCGGKAHFENTGNFRVNANGNCIDVWLIYACRQCNTTYNMTLYERISSNELRRENYEKFLKNDKSLAMSYGCDNQILKKNKAVVDWENITYRISEKVFKNQENQEYKESHVYQENSNAISNIKEMMESQIITLRCRYPLKIRIDKLFAEYLNISRTKVKQLIENKILEAFNSGNVSKKYISDGIEFILKERS